MRLTPLDIRKQEFKRAFRGLDPDEVDAFLQMLSGQWQQQLDDQRRLEEKVRDLESKLEHYNRVEEALEQALKTTRETSKQTIEAAKERANLIIEAAENRAVDIKRNAEDERHHLKREAAKVSGRRNEIVARLRAFLMSEMELLARFDGDDPVGFIKLLPAEGQSNAAGEHALPPAHGETTRPEREAPPETAAAQQPLPDMTAASDDRAPEEPDGLGKEQGLPAAFTPPPAPEKSPAPPASETPPAPEMTPAPEASPPVMDADASGRSEPASMEAPASMAAAASAGAPAGMVEPPAAPSEAPSPVATQEPIRPPAAFSSPMPMPYPEAATDRMSTDPMEEPSLPEPSWPQASLSEPSQPEPSQPETLAPEVNPFAVASEADHPAPAAREPADAPSAEVETPAARETPAAPNMPVAPEMPAASEMPAAPDMPAARETPAAPNMPAAPYEMPRRDYGTVASPFQRTPPWAPEPMPSPDAATPAADAAPSAPDEALDGTAHSVMDSLDHLFGGDEEVDREVSSFFDQNEAAEAAPEPSAPEETEDKPPVPGNAANKPGWVLHSLLSPTPGAEASDASESGLSASADELAEIRRILDDLE